MNGEVIKSFLVGLGFGVDEASLSKFNKAITSASLKVTALYGAIQTTATGVAYGISKISESFENLGYEYKIIAPAINKALILRKEMLRAYAATGVSLPKVIHNALLFNLSVTKTKYAFEALYKSVASRFFPMLTKQSDEFRKKLYDNMPKIQDALEKVVQFIFKLFDITLRLGERLWSIIGRLYDVLKQLHEATGGWSTGIIALAVAWRALNLAFIATPIGRLLALAAIMVSLYDDFKTWQEGGKSFWDWSDFVEETNKIINNLKTIWALLVTIKQAGGKAQDSFESILQGNFKAAFGEISSSAKDLFTNEGVLRNMQALNYSPAIVGKALGSDGGNQGNTNLTVNSQTNTSISGVADAHTAVDRINSVSTKQTQDIKRNMQGLILAGPPQ